MPPERPPVVVVGAGPGGAALALLLVSRAVPTVLIERQTDFEREFRGEVLMPSGLEVLDALGADMSRIAHRVPLDLSISFHHQRTLRFEIAPDQFRGRSPQIVSQPQMLEHLIELASRHDGFRFPRGSSVRDLIEDGGRIGGVRVAGREGEEVLHGSLVVGADGRSSVTRRRGAFAVRERGNPMDIVWSKIPWPAAWKEPVLRAYVGGGHLLIAIPAPDGLLQLAWVILKGTFGELRSRGHEEWVQAMADHVDAELAEHIRTFGETITRPFLLDVQTDRVLGWARPGLLLIGDAAHTMSPVGGQGLNLAMRDAVVAANHLVPAWHGGGGRGGLDRAALAVEPERGPEIDRIQALAAQPPRLIMRPGPVAELARRVLPHLVTSPIARRIGPGLIDDFFHGVTEVVLRV
jgi:2-polyprenyl-6-methoxyphenol hydroxylase-like FAD-dependent oxidoreductase